ncbi:UNVERIFIED_CONTAM: hypothetical protein FKN15_015040 [Acipenser sinensis]
MFSFRFASLFVCRVTSETVPLLAQVKKEEPLTPAQSESIPKFYFPRGRPKPNINIDALISRIEKTFSQFPNERATLEDMGKVAKACECPLYWKAPLFYAAGGDRTGFVSVHKFIAMWRKKLQTCHDDAAKFVHLLAKPSCNYLEEEDLIPFLQLTATTPALTGGARMNTRCPPKRVPSAARFFTLCRLTVQPPQSYSVGGQRSSGQLTGKPAGARPDYRGRWCAVIQRIFYNVNRSWTGKITCSDLRKSSFLQDTFTPSLLASDSNHSSLANKQHFFSIEYWFRCMDLDGDGVLSMYELEYFYEEQCQKLENMAIEPLPFEDCLCQMLDLVKPECEGKITLHDLKKCKLSHIFFDTFFNIEKYLDHEQKDPFSRDGENEGEEISDWERYAAEEYEILVAEEAANEQFDGCENDLDPIDRQISNELNLRGDKRSFFEIPNPHPNINLAEYEYEDDFE